MRCSSLAWLVAPALSLVASSVAVAGPHKMEIMAEDEGALLGPETPPTLRAAIFARVKELGATHIRMDVWWHPELPADQQEGMLANLDDRVADAQQSGLTVQMTVSPIAAAWGNYDKTPGVRAGGVNPDPEKYLAFLKAVVARFHAKHVNRFSIWNEPNHPGFLLAGTDGEKYYDLGVAGGHGAEMKALWKKIVHENVKLMRKVWAEGYAAIKAIDPSIEVLLGELSSGEKKEGSWGAERFLEDVVRHAKHPIRADGLALHPYQFSSRPESKKGLPAGNAGIGQLGDLQKALAGLAKRHRFETPDGKKVPIFVTEFGYFTSETVKGVANWTTTRAAWAKRAFEVALKAGVRQMEWYQLMPTPPGHGTWDSSILDVNANPQGPVFAALKGWIKNLNAHHQQLP